MPTSKFPCLTEWHFFCVHELVSPSITTLVTFWALLTSDEIAYGALYTAPSTFCHCYVQFREESCMPRQPTPSNAIMKRRHMILANRIHNRAAIGLLICDIDHGRSHASRGCLFEGSWKFVLAAHGTSSSSPARVRPERTFPSALFAPRGTQGS